jgi:hypothetical protein
MAGLLIESMSELMFIWQRGRLSDVLDQSVTVKC